MTQEEQIERAAAMLYDDPLRRHTGMSEEQLRLDARIFAAQIVGVVADEMSAAMGYEEWATDGWGIRGPRNDAQDRSEGENMTTDEAEAIIEFAARYWRNQWNPDGDSKSSRQLILQAADVLLDADDDTCEKVNFIYSEALQRIVDTDPAAVDAQRLAAKALGDVDEYRNTGKVAWESPLERVKRAEAAAKDFAQALTEISKCKPGSSQTDIPGLIARNALARHTEYAPDASDRKEKETG